MSQRAQRVRSRVGHTAGDSVDVVLTWFHVIVATEK